MVVYYALVVIWAICAVALLPKKIIYVVPLRSSIQKRPIDSHNFQVALMSFFLFLVMALRSNDVGVDTHQYAYHYEFISRYSWNRILGRSEFIYWSFLKICTELGIPWRMLLILYAYFVCITISMFVRNYCVNPFWAFFTYLCYGLFSMSMSGIRQTLAICLSLWGCKKYDEKKRFFAISLLVIASFIHNSATVGILLIACSYFDKMKFSKKWCALFCVIAILCIPLRVPIARLIGFLRPDRYEDMSLFSDKHKVNSLIVLISIAIPCACLIFWDEVNQCNPHMNSIFVASCIYAIFTIQSMNMILLGRLAFYFSFHVVALLSNTISAIHNKNTRIMAKVLTLVLCGYMFIKGSINGTYQIDNYSFFWN